MDWWIYIIKCADDTLYTGITTNIYRRIQKHNNSCGAKYTRGRTPVELKYFEGPYTKSLAAKREYTIKQMSVDAKYNLIKNGLV